MGMHGGGWFAFVRGEDDKDKKQHVTWPLLKRVLGYARPYRGRIILLLGTILAVTGLSLLTPLIMRDLIDRTLPAGNAGRLNRLAIALVLIPIAGGAINIFKRAVDGYLVTALGEAPEAAVRRVGESIRPEAR